MENQKNSIINPLLSQTSRQFYTKRLAQRSSSNAQIQKVLRLLNSTNNEKKHYMKVKTEQKQEPVNVMKEEMENMRKMARAKVENAVKKEGRQWKQLLEYFWNYSKSTSKDCLLMNEINFLLKMEETVKRSNRIRESSDRNQSKDYLQCRVKDQKLQLDNIKLQKEVKMLKNMLQFKENEVKVINASIKMVATQRQSSKIQDVQEIYRKSMRQEDSELHRELQAIKHANDMLHQQKKELQDKINQLKISNQNLCEQIIKNRNQSIQNKQKFEMWRNIMSMQNEQVISLKLDKDELRKSLLDLTKKYQNMLKKISKISTTDQSKLTQITKRSVEIFTEQIQSFQRVRTNFIVKGFYMPNSQDSKDTNPNYYRKYFNEKETISNAQGVKKSSKQTLRYYKPTFYVYLQKYFEYQGVDKENFQKIDLAVGVNFLATLRSILDSKYNEYLLSRKPNRQFSSLSNFALSWLSNFTLDVKTLKLEQITTDVCFETIGSFYVRLMSPHLNSNWQVITFRQFLLQTLTIDELMFYLKARNVLFKGEVLKGSGAFTQIIYVNILDALFLIQLVVTDFDYRKKLEEYIKRSSEFLRKKQLIDAHFILRLLIEYYHYKKAQNFSLLSKTFYIYVRQKNLNMPFESYIKIFDYISFDLNLIQKLQIYQKAFSLGRGTVFLENIFTVMNEQGYFCNEVQKIFEKKTTIQDICNNEKHKFVKYQEFPQSIQSLINIFQKKVMPESANLGIQWIKRLLSEQKMTKQKMVAQIFRTTQITFQLSIFYMKKLVHSKWLTEQDLLIMLPDLTNILQLLVKMSIQKENSIRFMQKFLKNNAARQILRLYRRKRLLNRSVLSTTEFLDRTKQKSDEIKKEFTNVIQYLKNKFCNQPKLTSQVQIQQ